MYQSNRGYMFLSISVQKHIEETCCFYPRLQRKHSLLLLLLFRLGETRQNNKRNSLGCRAGTVVATSARLLGRSLFFLNTSLTGLICSPLGIMRCRDSALSKCYSNLFHWGSMPRCKNLIHNFILFSWSEPALASVNFGDRVMATLVNTRGAKSLWTLA